MTPLRIVLAGALFAAAALAPALTAPGLAAAPAPKRAAAVLPDARRIDAAFAPYQRHGSPGCASGLVADGRLVWSRGYGLASLEQRVPNKPSTVFDLGSTSKQITAAAIVLLARDGRLSLDDDVRRHVPELPDYGDTITLRHLLSHTSGLRDYTDVLAFEGRREEDVTTVAEALQALVRQRGLNFRPGAEYRYSNSGFFLASIVVQRVAGKSLREFAAERIFGPLGMTHTLFMDDHALVVPGRATGYAPREGGGWQVAMSDWEQTGDGAVQSTVEDMAIWSAALDAGKVGGKETTDLLEAPSRLRDGTPIAYGLGLYTDTHRGLRIVQHGGAWAGFRAMLLRAPERRLAVVTLCNVASADTSGLSLAVLDAALDAQARPASREPSPARAGDLSSFAGTYVNEHLGEVAKVEARGGALVVAGLGVDGELVPEGEGRFRSRGERLRVTFDPEALRVSSVGYGPVPVVFRRATEAPTPDASALKALAGRYSNPEIGPAWVVDVAPGRPRLTLPAGDVVELTPVEADLYDAGWGLVRIQRSGRRRVTALVFTDRGLVDVTLRREP